MNSSSLFKAITVDSRALFCGKRAVATLAVAAALTACGGGSGDGTLPQSQSIATSAGLSVDTLAVGLKDEPYVTQVDVRGGTAPFSHEIVSGSLPPGLTLDGATGEISGRPAIAGEFHFTIRSLDARQQEYVQPLTIFIGDSAATASAATGLPPRPADTGRTQPLASPEPATSGPDVSNLLTIVAGMAEGEWSRVNINSFSDVWTPADLRPLYLKSNPDPSRIIGSWSSFAWDSTRAALILYGGGHANYRGNDVYLWRASSQRWERASLPSEMVQNSLGHINAIDGVDKAPASAHTYDNTIYLPVVDRTLVLGGAADANGGPYLTQASNGAARITGPYLFDASRAHPDKVGGSTGSHVQRVAPYPQIEGGNMWSNREAWLNASAASTPPAGTLSNGCTGYAQEGGFDVVYLRTASLLYRYQIRDITRPQDDIWSYAGRYYYGGSGNQSACGYDPIRKVFLSPHTTSPFIYWSMENPGLNNRDVLVTPTDPTGEFPTLLASNDIRLRNCGLEFDPVRNDFKLWCGDGRVWTVTPPTPLGPNGWTIVKSPAPVGVVPTEGLGTGILGKWKYVSNLDVFMGLADWVQGNIWVYKPAGWVNPAGTGNLPPSVAITTPVDGANYIQGAPIAVAANAADGDGNVVKVEFFANDVKIGETQAPPFSIVWNTASVGTHTLTAVATDNAGSRKTSFPVHVVVDPIVVANDPPSVQLLRPSDGSTSVYGTPVTLEASASDSDGTVSRVEFYSGSNKVGEANAAPFTYVWLLPPLGSNVLTAVATDDRGASTTSSALLLTVTQSSGGGNGATVTLQRGNGASSVADTYLSTYHKTLSFGSYGNVQDQFSNYSSLVRFAIFQSEGGPIPNGARITSATLSFYKYSAYNMVFGAHRILQDWSESAATWNQRHAGVPWSTTGANGLDADIASTPDATASTDFDPGWIDFDVTVAVHAMSLAPSLVNHGWRIKAISGYSSAIKKFYSSEFTGTPSLRPKLVITYE